MFRLASLTFNDGSQHELRDLAVIVGPNDSGKSATLRDIGEILIGKPPGIIVTAAAITRPTTADELRDQYGIEPYLRDDGIWIVSGLNASLTAAHQSGLGRKGDSQLDYRLGQEHAFLNTFGPFLVGQLGTEARLTSAKLGPANPNVPSSLLQAFYDAAPDVETSIDSELHKVFGIHIRLDYSALTQLAVRVGPEALLDLPREQRGTQKEFRRFPLLEQQGDGLRSYATILMVIETLKRPVFLVDEPEAFLHPPQAYRLGRYLAKASRQHQIVIATHSTDLLRGILDEGIEPDILRMTRSGPLNHVRSVSPDQLRGIIRDPLLQSARALEGLFYEGMVVTEADADRAFYSMIANRIANDAAIHFTHAQGKHTIEKIVNAYRSIGIGIASIVDLDILNDVDDFRRLLEAHGIPENMRGDFEASRSRLAGSINERPARELFEHWDQRLRSELDRHGKSGEDYRARLSAVRRLMEQLKREASPWSRVKEEGIAGFGASAADAHSLLKSMATYGIFVVPVGELEKWLPDYDLPKQRWIATALKVVRDSIIDLEKPPWDFIAQVLQYLGVAS